MDSKLLKLLQKSFDSELNDQERLRLEVGLKDFPELNEEKIRIERLRNLIAKQQLSFSPYFSAKVMTKINNLSNELELSQGMLFAFQRVAIPMLAAAIILILFSIFQDGAIAFDNLMGLNSLQPQYLSEFLLFSY